MKTTIKCLTGVRGRIVVLIALSGVALAVAYFGDLYKSEDAPRAEHIAVRTAETRDVASALIQVALANGYFVDAGLEVAQVLHSRPRAPRIVFLPTPPWHTPTAPRVA